MFRFLYFACLNVPTVLHFQNTFDVIYLRHSIAKLIIQKSFFALYLLAYIALPLWPTPKQVLLERPPAEVEVVQQMPLLPHSSHLQ